jgi:hypothetical protein
MRRPSYRFRTIYQFGFSLLITVALIVQFIYGVFESSGMSSAYIALFFSYFTILSNIFVAIVLFDEAQASFDRARATAVFCILTTGVIHGLFLRGPALQDVIANSIPWVNDVFHYIMPVVMGLDWILFPPQSKVKWISILKWILVTLIYLVYAEILGYFTNIYPYFFVDPTRLGGYLGVLRACIGFVPFFAIIGAVIVVSNRLRLLVKKKAITT